MPSEFYLAVERNGWREMVTKAIYITNYIRLCCQQKLELMVLFQESLTEVQQVPWLLPGPKPAKKKKKTKTKLTLTIVIFIQDRKSDKC